VYWVVDPAATKGRGFEPWTVPPLPFLSAVLHRLALTEAKLTVSSMPLQEETRAPGSRSRVTLAASGEPVTASTEGRASRGGAEAMLGPTRKRSGYFAGCQVKVSKVLATARTAGFPNPALPLGGGLSRMVQVRFRAYPWPIDYGLRARRGRADDLLGEVVGCPRQDSPRDVREPNEPVGQHQPYTQLQRRASRHASRLVAEKRQRTIFELGAWQAACLTAALRPKMAALSLAP
jgi:hypothetical protein